MRENQKDEWARTVFTWAMSALLAMQLAGTPLPAAIAQEAGVGTGQGEATVGATEERETADEKGKGAGASPQADEGTGAPTATEEAALTAQGSQDDAPLIAQGDQDAVTYVNESGNLTTRDSYTLVVEPASEDPLTLSDGWYVVRGQVTATKRIEVQGDAHLILCDGAKLIASKGVHNAKGSTLSVYGQEQHAGELQARGDDTAHSAGIGGNEGEKAGTFNAYGARTVVHGGQYAAGIGGGYKNDGGTVLVRGEKTIVTANGGAYGAGIGGGNSGGWDDKPGTGYTGTVTIEGGTVTAQGGVCGAGIGGGNGYGADSGGGTVTITGGTVNATGGENGAGIGGANGYINKRKGHTAGADVFITGGAVTATGGNNSPGIGTGCLNASGGSLTVTGGNVNATGGGGGAGIGGGSVNRNDGEEDGDYPVTITGGNVKAKPESGLGAGIGGGLNGDGVTVKIGGTAYVEATGGNGGAGIGSGDGGLDPGSFEASGGTVIAKSGPNAAGIGTGKTAYERHLAEPKITITGGNIKAYGDNYGAGIGGGAYASGGTVTITGGKVLADGRDIHGGGNNVGGAGIGAGCGISYGEIPTNGGKVIIGGEAEVTAIGGKQCAGIGGGLRGDGADVTIGGTATVTATGGEGGAGIGGGYRTDGFGGAGRKVTIDGGTVTAQAGAPISGSPTEAVGHGSGWDASGDLTVYDAAKVRYSSEAEGAGAAISTAAQRIEKCRDLWAQIGPCEHKDAGGASTATLKPTADGLHHVEGCTQCLYVRSDQSGKPIEYDHEFDAGGACACGAHAHKVSFEKNASRATGTMAAPYVVEQTACELPTCGFERDGYAFAGWDTQAQGGGDAYADRATLTMGEADVTLFAQWQPARFGDITGVAASYVYNGKPHQPKPSVKGPEGQALKEGTDYRLEYANNVNATTGNNKAKVLIIGIGEYANAATGTVEFVIQKSTPERASKPSTIAHLAAGTIDASWKAVKGAKTYELSWRAAGGKWKTKKVNKTSYTIPGLKADKLYDIRVRGVDGSAKGAWSKTTCRWFKSASKVKGNSGKSRGSIKVSWKKDKKATGGYKVLVYAKKGGKAVATMTVSKAKASATIKGLKSGKTYYVRVRPYRTRGGATYVGVLSSYRSAKAK